MRRSSERILTTHTGSLPRPAGAALPGTPELGGAEADPEVVRAAVAEIVRHQRQVGVDVVNDGEQSKPSYSTYVVNRLSGFEMAPSVAQRIPEVDEYPEYFARFGRQLDEAMTNPVCVGPITYRDHSAVEADIANLQAAGAAAGAQELFMTAASPGVISLFMMDQHYNDHAAYIGALADAMRQEYEAIAAAGIILQVDCPDLTQWPMYEAQGKSKEEFLSMISGHVDAINAATANIDPDQMRMHVCWGNYEGPHTHDIDLREIVDRVLRARPNGLLLEGSNPRHGHEWAVFEEVALPDDKVLVTGVLDTTCNYIEHPELVAERLERLAKLIGMERVMAGTDCGFATFAQALPVDPRIVWAKLAAMSEGAEIATRRLTA